RRPRQALGHRPGRLQIVERAEMVLQVGERGTELLLPADSLLLPVETGEELRAVSELLGGDPRPVPRVRIEVPEASAALLQARPRLVEDLRGEVPSVDGRVRPGCPRP